jgi:hypothetical protein
LKITNLFGLPEALVNAVSVRPHNAPGSLSATTLLKNMKQILLTSRHWDEIEEDVLDRFWALFGSAIHKMLEHEGENDFTEESMSHEIDGITVTGQIDLYNMATGEIADWKSCSVYKVLKEDFEDWRKQGLIYAWLLHKNDFLVKTCRFIAIMKDHSMRKARHSPSYPKHPVYVYEFPITEHSLAEIETYIKDKISEYKRFKDIADNDIPFCTADERWENPTVFAVKKDGNKRAYKILKTIEEAEKIAGDMGKGYSVEKRQGEAKRCMDYCSCNMFCNYYRDNVAAVEAQDEVNWL